MIVPLKNDSIRAHLHQQITVPSAPSIRHKLHWFVVEQQAEWGGEYDKCAAESVEAGEYNDFLQYCALYLTAATQLGR